MNNRDNTNFDSTIPNDATVSGVRPVSMGSIALLQLIDNPIGTALLRGEDIPFENSMAMLQFAYIHTHNLEDLTHDVLKFKAEPEALFNKVVQWGVEISPNDMLNIYVDIMRDRDNIKNAKTTVISSGSKDGKSKNEHGQR